MEKGGSKSGDKSVPESGLEPVSTDSLLKGFQIHVVLRHFIFEISHWDLAKW